ncbi:class I SAM-dependent methyltransferase [Burkholderia sp. Ax-1719]|uniref:class I SAM-dependent methyltransferase n=1 Tax=Burkholderia sp. Ax-1719 TaxID=2608334 RepID=UPI00141DD2D1|nr:class I SAM-dependent methyltransferase [Burkholderia sp. Ax-1719]NIE64951.1 class I SAM-dependent methyltransferase [Burkholderia sp. Ax-1719]
MSDRTIIDWPAWTASPAGRYVLGWEQEQLDRMVSNVFGYHALQLGLPQLDALRENRMTYRGLVLDSASAASAPFTVPSAEPPRAPALHTPDGRSAVWCDYLDLPFEAQSVDLIVMPHTLEFTSDPHRLLREAERVLMPEGQLVIVGFNSLSLWGARQSAGKLTGHPFLPARQDLIAFTRLKDWIKLLGFELERGRFGCYRPPLSTDKWLGRYEFMEAAGDRWWAIFGAVYMVTAIKRVRGMRLVGPLKVKKPVLAPSLKAAATTPSPTRNKDS